MSLAITPSSSIVNVTVYGASTGSIGTTTVSGGTAPYTIAWTVSTGATAISDTTDGAKTGLKSGIYRITVTDSASTPATVYYDYTITQSAQLTITPGRITHASSEETSDAAIAATTITGGLAPYTIVWGTEDGTQITDMTASAHVNLMPGTYRINVTDDAEVSVYHDYVVVVQTYEGLDYTPGEIEEYIEDGKHLATIAESSVEGGDEDYIITWKAHPHGTAIRDATLDEKTKLLSGNYTVTIVDGSGNGVIYEYVMDHHKKLYHHPTGWSAHNPLRE